MTAADAELAAALAELGSDRGRAMGIVEALARRGDALAAAVWRHLRGAERGSVYVDPEGFRRFITGGGNVRLYAATSAALAARYPAGPLRLLDVGTGDGLAAIPALERRGGRGGPVVVDAVEPSDELRAALAAAVAGSPHEWRLHGQTVQAFFSLLARISHRLQAPRRDPRAPARRSGACRPRHGAAMPPGARHPLATQSLASSASRPEAGEKCGLDAAPGAPWDVAQATFSLHNLDAATLAATLRRLRPHVGRLVVVEFDVPPFTGQHDPARVRYCVERYRDGIAEYADAPVVVDGFLVPVLLGGLDATTPQTTFERPAAEWAEALHTAGFSSVEVEPVSDYWWAPAVVLTAS